MTIEDDKKRFTEIYNREVDSLFRFCLIRVSDRERAIDLVQESFTRLWNAVVSGKEMKNPRALLYVVARNLIIDWYRRVKSVSIESMSGDEDDMEFDAPDKFADLKIEIDADSGRILEMLGDLEEGHREVIYLRFVADLPPKDIAKILGLNANTVSVRLTRGMEALRRIIGIDKNKEEE